MLTSTALELAVYQSDFRTVQVTVVEFQVHPSQYNEYTASTWNNGSFYSFVYNYYRQNSFFTGKDLFESSSVLVLVCTYCQSGISTLVSKSKSTASGASIDDR